MVTSRAQIKETAGKGDTPHLILTYELLHSLKQRFGGREGQNVNKDRRPKLPKGCVFMSSSWVNRDGRRAGPQACELLLSLP